MPTIKITYGEDLTRTRFQEVWVGSLRGGVSRKETQGLGKPPSVQGMAVQTRDVK